MQWEDALALGIRRDGLEQKRKNKTTSSIFSCFRGLFSSSKGAKIATISDDLQMVHLMRKRPPSMTRALSTAQREADVQHVRL